MMVKTLKNVCAVAKQMVYASRKFGTVQVAPLQEAALNERCILVDECDKVIGESTKRDCHTVDSNGHIPLHRAFSVFLFNGKGELLMQKRSANKVTFPNNYANTCCSHPLAEIPQETEENEAIGIRRAAIRRMGYELGIPKDEILPSDLIYLTRVHYFMAHGHWGEHEIDYILFAQKDHVTLDPNPDEIAQLHWISKSNINEFIKNLDGPLSPWFHLVLKNRLLLWWENLHALEKMKDHGTIHKFK
ncbi:isopentenyl-diphosphate delta isomerase [Augochlora pura]